MPGDLEKLLLRLLDRDPKTRMKSDEVADDHFFRNYVNLIYHGWVNIYSTVFKYLQANVIFQAKPPIMAHAKSEYDMGFLDRSVNYWRPGNNLVCINA